MKQAKLGTVLRENKKKSWDKINECVGSNYFAETMLFIGLLPAQVTRLYH